MSQKSIPGLIAEKLLSRLPLFQFEPEALLLVEPQEQMTLACLARYSAVKLEQVSLSELPTVPQGKFDGVFLHECVYAAEDLAASFKACQRLCKPGGMILLSTFGPQSCASALSVETEALSLIDMHDVGDCLVKAGFQSPVLERELLSLSYSSEATQLEDLALWTTLDPYFSRLYQTLNLAQLDSRVCTLEIIIAHAFSSELSGQTAVTDEFTFPIDHLRRRL